MESYKALLKNITLNGVQRPDRTGVGTRAIFGHQLRFNLNDGLPVVTTKYCHLKSIIHELLWMIKGDTNIKYLQDNGVRIWNEWANENGDLGPVYGKQWRAWYSDDGSIDQLKIAISNIITDPYSRRLILSNWNVGDLNKMALPPCHILTQFFVADNKLSCQVYQRSADCFLGLPFDLVFYGILTEMVAQVTNLGANELIYTLGDAHIYNNHIEQVDLLLTREPKKLPTLKLNKKINDLFAFTAADIEINNYQYHPKIKAPVAV